MSLKRTVIVVVLLALLDVLGRPPELPAEQHLAQRVHLRETVQVRGETILLADLLPGASPAALRARAAQVVLGRAPQPGSLRAIRRPQLEHALRNDPDLLKTLRIPERITVGRVHRQLSRKEILRAIGTALERNGFRETVSLVREQQPLRAPVLVTQDDPGLEVTRMEFDLVQQQIRFRLSLSKERRVLPFYVMVRVPGFLPPAVARHDQLRGKEAGEADFPREPQGEMRNPGGSLRTLGEPAGGEPAGHRARPPIWARARMTPGMARPPVLAKPGQPATVLVQGDGFRILTTAVPLQRGRKGQKIRVRSLATRRVFMAEVLDRGYLRALF